MRCIVRIVRAEIRTRDVRLEAPSVPEAKSQVVRDTGLHEANDGWKIEAVNYDYECEEEDPER